MKQRKTETEPKSNWVMKLQPAS